MHTCLDHTCSWAWKHQLIMATLFGYKCIACACLHGSIELKSDMWCFHTCLFLHTCVHTSFEQHPKVGFNSTEVEILGSNTENVVFRTICCTSKVHSWKVCSQRIQPERKLQDIERAFLGTQLPKKWCKSFFKQALHASDACMWVRNMCPIASRTSSSCLLLIHRRVTMRVYPAEH